MPALVVTDGTPGLVRAAEEIFPHSLRQRSIAFAGKTHNVTDLLTATLLETYQDRYPSAMRPFQEDWDACQETSALQARQLAA